MAGEFKFSFSLPVFNSQKYLQRCLESIRSQDYPQSEVEILVVDAGSTDNTLDIAKRYGAVILDNPRRLGEYGMKIAVANASGDLLVLFAADNGLVGRDWLKKASAAFQKYNDLSCIWGRMIASADDPAIMKYYELIQSEPLAFLLNKNLQFYLRGLKPEQIAGTAYYIFNATPLRPLCWGANGIVYRLRNVKDLFLGEQYIGDNEIFHKMLEEGHTLVGYSFGLKIYHHTVSSVFDWVKKWKRNYTQIFLKTRKERKIAWFYYGNFKLKMFFWLIYSLIPVFSFLHALYLTVRNRNVFWLFHPLMSFLQSCTYLYWSLASSQGRQNIADHFFSKQWKSC